MDLTIFHKNEKSYTMKKKLTKQNKNKNKYKIKKKKQNKTYISVKW